MKAVFVLHARARPSYNKTYNKKRTLVLGLYPLKEKERFFNYKRDHHATLDTLCLYYKKALELL